MCLACRAAHHVCVFRAMNSSMKDDFITFGKPEIGEDEIAEVLATLRSGWLGTGPRVARFERDFARYRSVSEEQVAAVNSGTAALHLGLLASGVGPGDEVIVPAMTFCASVNAIIHAGATPVLADVCPDSMNLDPSDVERRLTSRTRAILPVHFAGRACDMDALGDIRTRHRLKMIEDCAHAIETTWNDQPVGTFGDFGCFSFYVTKNATTGEGGMVIARDPENISRIKRLALHGMSKDAWRRFGDDGYKHYAVVEAGFKYNMMDLQAAIGIHQLARIDELQKKRRLLWECYRSSFKDLPLTLPSLGAAESAHARHLFPMLIDENRCNVSRDEFLDAMTQRGIGVGVHYLSIADHPFYRDRFGFHPDDCPVARDVGRQTVSLPLSGAVTEPQRDRIVSAVRAIFT